MEFLSSEFNFTNSSFPVNLVLQSREAAQVGFNAQKTPNFVKAYLPFNPTAGFHEYRIDFLPDNVYFYADGKLLAAMTGAAVPTSPGHLVLQHWSNGNPLWSRGPPAEDAVLTVRYVKAYFNSSSPQRQQDWASRCKNPNAHGAVCGIPEVTTANKSAELWFFSARDNMTNNQIVYGSSAPTFNSRWQGIGASWYLPVLIMILWTEARFLRLW
jgi:hypothetical protein